MDFCKTRTEKSSPDMFNCYVTLAGHDVITDAGSATTCRHKLKAQSLQTKSTKMEVLQKITFTEKQFNDFRQKNTLLSVDQTTPGNTRPLNATIEDGFDNLEEINRRKTEKSIQIKTARTLQD